MAQAFDDAIREQLDHQKEALLAIEAVLLDDPDNEEVVQVCLALHQLY